MSSISKFRELFSLSPSTSLWNQLCIHLDSLRIHESVPEEEMEGLIEYALHHLENWPVEFREAPPHWLNSILAGEPLPSWPLVRSLRIVGAKVSYIRKVCKSPFMQDIQRVSFEDCTLGPKTGLQALGKATNLPSLQTLRIQKGVVSDPGWQLLLQSPLLSQLTSLTLIPENRYIARKDMLSDKMYGALAEASHLKNLRSLTLGFIEPISFGETLHESVPALAKAPHLQSLESLTLQGWDHDSLELFVEEYGWENIKELDLWGSSISEKTLQRLAEEHLASSLTSLRLNLESAFDPPALSGVRSETLLDFFQTAPLTSLRHLRLDTHDLWDVESMLEQPWVTGLTSLEIVGKLSDRSYALLATHPHLANLEVLGLHRPFHEEEYYRQRSMTLHSLTGLEAAKAWLETTQRPRLKEFQNSLKFSFSEEDREELVGLYLSLSPDDLYPAWLQWVESLAHAGVSLESSQRSAASRQTFELKTIRLEWETSEEEVKQLLEEGKLENCGTLVLDTTPENKDPQLFVEILSSPELCRLEHLELGSVGRFTPGEQLNEILLAIAHNANLTQLQTFDHCMNGYDLLAIQGFLAIKTSPHLAGSVRESMSIKDTFSTNFSPWTDGSNMQFICDCEELSGLEELDFSTLCVNNKGAKLLAGCPHLTNLKRLDLSRCSIGDAGAKALAKSRFLTSLEELKLGYNSDITVNGYKALVESETLPAKVRKKFKRKAK